MLNLRQYGTNLKLWAVGWTNLGSLKYKPGWNAWKFAPVYATTYLLGTLWGVAGVSSLSRIWYERGVYILEKPCSLGCVKCLPQRVVGVCGGDRCAAGVHPGQL